MLRDGWALTSFSYNANPIPCFGREVRGEGNQNYKQAIVLDCGDVLWFTFHRKGVPQVKGAPNAKSSIPKPNQRKLGFHVFHKKSRFSRLAILTDSRERLACMRSRLALS